MASIPRQPDGTPLFAIFGEVPSRSVDIPICAVIIVALACLAIINVRIFRTNKNNGYFFPMNMVLFGFCMARITTFIMRIAWTENVSNEGLMIAAQVLVSAGVLLQYVVNLICTKRLLDARHPGFGRHPLVRLAFHLLYISILALIVTMIVVMVRFFTGKTLSAGEDNLRKAAPIYFTIISFIPIPLATAVALVPSQIPEGSMVLGIGPSTLKIRLFIIYNVSFWLTLAAAVRSAVLFLPPRLSSDPAWYHKRPTFYVFTIVCELIGLLTFVILRFDQKFYIPGRAERKAAAKAKSEEEAVSEEKV